MGQSYHAKISILIQTSNPYPFIFSFELLEHRYGSCLPFPGKEEQRMLILKLEMRKSGCTNFLREPLCCTWVLSFFPNRNDRLTPRRVELVFRSTIVFSVNIFSYSFPGVTFFPSPVDISFPSCNPTRSFSLHCR